ncbi:hypothetical protein M0813_01217 [Anaeramoeba flamelloides]|uniref:EF-hand domain-containing protein n=1 Tax=Anaeramoeba flamelloides TaxID=1746091 RepID=A0ABQ8ZC83_9EUKA|nr:hypothetical protein M0813_01217 [Anaeramoeba flamelloides]
MDSDEKALELYNNLKTLSGYFFGVHKNCENLTIRLTLVAGCLNIIASNNILDGKTQEAFQQILGQLESIQTEIRKFVQKMTQVAGPKPRKAKFKKKTKLFQRKFTEWTMKLKNFFELEINQKTLASFEKKLNVILSATNLALQVEMAMGIKEILSQTKKNEETTNKILGSILSIEDNIVNIDSNLSLLMNELLEKKNKRNELIITACRNKTPKALSEISEFNEKGGKILFNLISQRKCTEEEGLKNQQVYNYFNLFDKRIGIRMKFIAKFFFKSWDTDKNNFLSQEEVQQNLEDAIYLATLVRYKKINHVSYLAGYNNTKTKEQTEKQRLQDEQYLKKKIKKQQFIEKLFSQDKKSYYNDQGEINKKGFAKFCWKKQDKIIGDIFNDCIEVKKYCWHKD